MRMMKDEYLDHNDMVVITAASTTTVSTKPVWHQELFDQALSVFHGASPAILTPATYEYITAIYWMNAHHESVLNLSLNAIDHMSAEVAAWALHPDLTIFDHPPVQLIGHIGF